MNIAKPKIIAGAIGQVLLMVGANYGQFKVVEYGLRVEATREVGHWVQQIIRTAPGSEKLLSTNAFSPEQLARLPETAEFGDIVQYQLYDVRGKLVVDHAPAATGADDEQALEVLRSGKAIAAVGSPDRFLIDV